MENIDYKYALNYGWGAVEVPLIDETVCLYVKAGGSAYPLKLNVDETNYLRMTPLYQEGENEIEYKKDPVETLINEGFHFSQNENCFLVPYSYVRDTSAHGFFFTLENYKTFTTTSIRSFHLSTCGVIAAKNIARLYQNSYDPDSSVDLSDYVARESNIGNVAYLITGLFDTVLLKIMKEPEKVLFFMSLDNVPERWLNLNKIATVLANFKCEIFTSQFADVDEETNVTLLESNKAHLMFLFETKVFDELDLQTAIIESTMTKLIIDNMDNNDLDLI